MLYVQIQYVYNTNICKVIYVGKSLRREEYSSSLCAAKYTSIVQIQVHVVDHVEQNTCSKLFVQQVCVYIHRKVSITVSCNVTYYICLFRHVCSCESALLVNNLVGTRDESVCLR